MKYYILKETNNTNNCNKKVSTFSLNKLSKFIFLCLINSSIFARVGYLEVIKQPIHWVQKVYRYIRQPPIRRPQWGCHTCQQLLNNEAASIRQLGMTISQFGLDLYSFVFFLTQTGSSSMIELHEVWDDGLVVCAKQIRLWVADE